MQEGWRRTSPMCENRGLRQKLRALDRELFSETLPPRTDGER